jgi:N-acetylglucosaminyl-diphospho-decaprenol L-rhamnosyltransferase
VIPIPKISVITVLYGNSAVVLDCVKTWLKSTGPLSIEFIFVDNHRAEPFQHSEARKHLHGNSSMVYLFDGQNHGFAGGSNHGAKHAQASHILFLNPDVKVEEEFFSKVLQHVERTKASVSAISLVTMGKPHLGIRMDMFGMFHDAHLPNRHILVGPSGGAALFEKKLFESIGGFNESLFAWGEDAELALRLYSKGITCDQLDLRLWHFGGHTVSAHEIRKLKARILVRNRIWVFRYRYSKTLKLALLLPFSAYLLGNGVIRKVPNHLGMAYFQGVLEGLFSSNPSMRQSGTSFGLENFLSTRNKI